MKKHFVYLSAALFILGAPLPSSAKVSIEKLGSVQTGELYSPVYQSLELRDSGDLLVFGLPSPNLLKVWNLTKGKEETSLALNIAPGANRWVRIERVAQAPNGDLMAILTEFGSAGQYRVFVVNVSMGMVANPLDSNSGLGINFLVSRSKLFIALSGGEPGPKFGDPYTYVYRLFDASTMQTVAKLQTDFSGDIRLFEDKSGVNAVISGYEVVAIWSTADNKVKKLIEGKQPSLWPQLVKAPGGALLLQVDDPKSGVPGATVLYDYHHLKMGHLHAKKNLSASERLVLIDGNVTILDIKTGAKPFDVDQELILKDFIGGKTLGKVVVDFGIRHTRFTRNSKGEILALVSGPTKPNLFVSPARLLYVNLTRDKILHRFDHPQDLSFVTLASGKDDVLLSEFDTYVEEPMVVDPIKQIVLTQPDGRMALAPLFSMKDGRLASIHGDPRSGETCVIDWTDDGAKDCFAEGTFVAGAIPYAYSESLNVPGLGKGRSFIVPSLKMGDNGGSTVVGLAAFRLN